MRKTATVVGIVLVIALTASISLWIFLRGSTSRDPIRITMHLWPGYVHTYIAQEKGFFKEEGVEVALNLIE